MTGGPRRHPGRVSRAPDREGKIGVVIADDHPVVRRGLTALVDSLDGFEVVGEAADGEAAVREVVLTRPDVVLMDVQMPGLDGVEATRRLGISAPQVPVLVLTMYDDDATVFTDHAGGRARIPPQGRAAG